MSKHWKRVLETKPGLVDSIVYFSPTKKRDLACIIRDDGTVSPASWPALRFDSAVKLAEMWKKGEIKTENGELLPSRVNLTNLAFSSDFFFKTGRKGSVKNILQPYKKKAEEVVVDPDSRPVEDTAQSSGRVEATLADRELPTNASTVDHVSSIGVPAVDRTSPAYAIAVDQAPTINVLTAKKKPCPGLNRRTYQAVISNRQWDSARMEFSPVVFHGDRCWSKTCEGEINEYRTLCWDCKVAKKTLSVSRRHLDKPRNEERRIQNTANRWLTDEEMTKKVAYLLKSKKETTSEFRRKVNSLQRELDEYRPKEVDSRLAVRSIVRKVNEEERKLRSPVCRWLTEDKKACGFEAPSVTVLNDHIGEAHLQPQAEANKERPQGEQVYKCHWLGCRRLTPIKKLPHLRRHVVIHSGNAQTEKQLASIREQLINLARPPTGRRYERNRRMIASIDEVAHASTNLALSTSAQTYSVD